MQRIEFRAMGSHMSAMLDTERSSAPLAAVPAWFEEWEQPLSRFRADSELNQLNRSAGQWVRVSPTLWDVLQLGIRAAQWTDGLVTPVILNAVEAAGYDRTFDAIQPDDRPVTPQPDGEAAGLWRSIERHASNRAIFLPPHARIDLGGVAKGWAAERAARKLSQHAPALVDAGGDIAMSGSRADGQPWPIGVSNPFQPDQHLEVLKICQGGVATSGRDYRRWQKDGMWQHHIIDPRTGLPAQTDVISATVIAPTTYEAEVAAKVVLISGSAAGLEWIEALPDFAALIVLEDGRVLYSTRFSDYLWR